MLALVMYDTSQPTRSSHTFFDRNANGGHKRNDLIRQITGQI